MNRSRNLLVAAGTGFALLALIAALTMSSERESRPSATLPGRETTSHPGTIQTRLMEVETVASVSRRTAADQRDSDRPVSTRSVSHDSGPRAVAFQQKPSEPPVLDQVSPSPFRGESAPADERMEMSVANASAEPRWIPTNPQLPGNSLSLKGQHAEIHGFQPAPGSVGVGLSLMVSDEPDSVVPQSSAMSAETAPSGTNAVSATGSSGFTYEQELFRTKWGWAAYDQVRRTLREETTQ